MTEVVTPETTTPPPAWYIDDATPATGARPDWMPEKFKSVSDLAKSYHELEKKVGTAPEEYDFTKSKFLDPDYVPFQELAALAKEKRVPKEVMDKMLESVDKYMDEFAPNPAEEYKKLGDNAPERLKTLDNWLKVNLSPEAFAAVTDNLKSADAIKALETLRAKMMGNNTMIPNGNDSNANEVATVEQLKEELSANYAKYKSDPKYRQDWQGRLELASKNSGVLDKSGP